MRQLVSVCLLLVVFVVAAGVPNSSSSQATTQQIDSSQPDNVTSDVTIYTTGNMTSNLTESQYFIIPLTDNRTNNQNSAERENDGAIFPGQSVDQLTVKPMTRKPFGLKFHLDSIAKNVSEFTEPAKSAARPAKDTAPSLYFKATQIYRSSSFLLHDAFYKACSLERSTRQNRHESQGDGHADF